MPSEPRPREVPHASARPSGSETPSRDLQLVAAVLSKDRKAAADLVSLHADAVFAYVKRRLAPRADLVDDVVQDVFLAALASLASYHGASSLRTWLLGIARHKVETYYRERLRSAMPLGEDEEMNVAALSPQPDDTIHRDRMEAKTQRLLREMPEPYGLALLWRYWEGRSAREIALATGRTEKAVERLLARARARFRELWET